ncbi:hypothetical protein [Nocardia iowensis]|uniref:Secreted protein n=1 Tax=Nocardia iowensis TaxID=204891 RepID=A0ABX8RI43_NOCIO|nr:hypothetical protein [Nocardia iowensis]QXN89021.1 hypothetical protein KV110_26100 [Nocardia iowensis]
MNSVMKRMVVGVSAATLIGASTVLSAAPAQAQPAPHCSVNPVAGTGAYSQCGAPVWHQVRITCWAWWAWFSSYERWGNPAFGGWHSETACDLPFTMQTWEVITYP